MVRHLVTKYNVDPTVRERNDVSSGIDYVLNPCMEFCAHCTQLYI